jgi:hypothetical protein
MEKTGSTSIQRALHIHRAEVRDAGILYPSADLSKLNHNFLASAYIPPESDRRSRGIASQMREGRRARYLESYRARVMAEIGRGERVILSGEHLFRLEADEIRRFKDDLSAAGVEEALVFGILRSPASFYLSLIQQELKGSSTFPMPDAFFVPYASRVAGWQEHFTCRFFEFSSLSASAEGIVGRFMEEAERFLDVRLPSLRHNVPRANDSLSAEEMQVLQDFRRRWFPTRDGILNRPTGRLMRDLQAMRDENWRKPKLRPEVAARIDRRHREEAAALLEAAGIDLPAVSAAEGSAPAAIRDVRDVLANFDDGLYARLSKRVGTKGYGTFRKALSSMSKLIGIPRA